MLVVISIIALLLSLLMPALSKCRRAGQNLKCVSQMRDVAFKFRIFADDYTVKDRGDSGPHKFYMEDFLDSVYLVDEFWDLPNMLRTTYRPNEVPMICPAGEQFLRRRPNRPCTNGAVFPRENVSVAINRRLYRAGPNPFQSKVLSSRILNYPNVPLAIDVDGAASWAVGILPYFTAPPLDDVDGYEDGSYWYPARRHEGKFNVAFVGGHVSSAREAVLSSNWRWDHVPE